jgi:hypothetical protein
VGKKGFALDGGGGWGDKNFFPPSILWGELICTLPPLEGKKSLSLSVEWARIGFATSIEEGGGQQIHSLGGVNTCFFDPFLSEAKINSRPQWRESI